MTKSIMLSSGHVCLVDDEDFGAVSRWSWFPHKARQAADKVYAYAKIAKKATSMHRFIMQPTDGQEVDHANGDPLDNRRSNLRLCTRSQNCANIRRRPGSSGYVGVHPRNNRWAASVHKDGKKIGVGVFPTAEEAARARDEKAVELFGEFAVLNFARESL